MIHFFQNILDAADFMPHQHCYLLERNVMWLHAVADILIALAYYSIPLQLLYFIRKRRDLPFPWIFALFGVFIVGCGTTHVMDVYTLWTPIYRAAGLLKIFTAGVSLLTAGLLFPLIPQALRLASPAQLLKANQALEEEIARRQKVEDALRESEANLAEANRALDQKVRERTSDLLSANEQLQESQGRLEARVRQQAALAGLSRQALAEENVEQLFAVTTETVAHTLDVEYADLFERESLGGALRLQASRGWAEGEARMEASADSPAGLVLRSGEPLVVENFDGESRFTESRHFREHEIQSSMSVAVWHRGIAQGVLGAHSKSARSFSAEDVNFLQSAANLLAAAIERTNSEKAMRKAREEAERANNAKSEFLSRMSHELRTPLNAILGFGQLLAMDGGSAEQRSSVEQIIQAGRHLLELINEVLEIARIEAGKAVVLLEPISVHDLASETIDLLQPLARPRSVSLSLEKGDGECVRVDRRRLRQVLLNLLSNAIKFNREGGQVTIRTGAVGADRVRIEIIDTGIGIPAERMSAIFDPFERFDADLHGIEGSGIGLTVCKRLVELMGGEIGVRSSAEGSTFYVEFAAAEARVAALPEGSVSQTTSSEGGTGTVLYIEDNRSNLRLVEQTLRHRPGVTLVAAMLGETGISLARERRPDLILLDLHLPDISGEHVFERLRADERTSSTPVVILSADATPSQVKRLRAAGVADYLTKPLELDKLLGTIDQLIPAAVQV